PLREPEGEPPRAPDVRAQVALEVVSGHEPRDAVPAFGVEVGEERPVELERVGAPPEDPRPARRRLEPSAVEDAAALAEARDPRLAREVELEAALELDRPEGALDPAQDQAHRDPTRRQ